MIVFLAFGCSTWYHKSLSSKALYALCHSDHWHMLLISFQVDEIYHDESLGTNINIVLVRMIMVGYRQVSHATQFVSVQAAFQMSF